MKTDKIIMSNIFFSLQVAISKQDCLSRVLCGTKKVFANFQHAMHMQRSYPQEAMWMPVWMVYHFIWKRTLKIK